MPDGGLPNDVAAELFAQWCSVLAATTLGIQGSGAGSAGLERIYTFGSGADKRFSLTRDPNSNVWRLKERVGIEESPIRSILTSAASRTAARDFGDEILYQVQLESKTPDLGTRQNQLNFARLLGAQVRIAGRRRLSDRVLLEFIEDPAAEPLLFAPTTRIKVTVFVPGPGEGPLTQRVAFALIETVAAIIAFALGRSVALPPLGVVPLRAAADVAAAGRLRSDPSIGGLARAGVSLDIFGDLVKLGGSEAMLRARAAFITLHEALAQTNADVATILYVSAIEALIAPNQGWGRDRLTKRFVEAVLSLCTTAIDETLAHQNLEQAFQYRKKGSKEQQRRRLLERIYHLRSRPSHEGMGLSGGAMFNLIVGDTSIRLGLLSDITTAAVLAYLTAPRSFLTGHPGVDPRPLDTSA